MIQRTVTPSTRSSVRYRSVRQEPGCVTYIPHFVEGEPCTVLIYEQYTDEAALDHHRGSPHFHQYAIGGLYQKMKDRRLGKPICRLLTVFARLLRWFLRLMVLSGPYD